MLLCCLILAGCSSYTVPDQDVPSLVDPTEEDRKLDALKDGRRLIDEREQDDNLNKAIRLLHWQASQKPDSAELQRLAAEACSRALELLDPKKPEDRARHQMLRQIGRPHADAAVHLAPDDGVARYWRACILLHEANAEQSLGKTKEAMAELEKAESLAPAVDDGGPSRMRGKVLSEMPMLLGGSLSKAVAAYKRSLEQSPDRITTHLWLGEAFISAKKTDLARKELEWVVAAKPRKGHEKEDGTDQQEAAEKLKSLK